MPPTAKTCSSLLSIAIDEPAKVYSPGDVVVGHVIRQQHLVSAQTRITLTLCGRAKSRLEIQSGQSHKVRRSRFQLIDERQSSQLIHDGPIHIPQGGEQPLVVPFTVDIPTHVPREMSGNERTSFLPLDPDSVAHQRLPSTISTPSRNSRVEAFVEYFLEAKMDVSGHDGITATIPIVLRSYIDGPRITNYHLKSSHQICSVSSQRLVPGMQDAEPSMKHKMKLLFGTDPVPTFGFRLEVGTPTVMQLEDPGPVPITLRAVPDWRYATEKVKGVPQKITLRKMHLAIETRTLARADDVFDPYEKESKYKMDVPFDRVIGTLALHGNSMTIPCTDEWPALDIGDKFGFRIGYEGPAGIWKTTPGLPTRIYPTMETYNFQVSHRLHWEVILDVVGKECQVRGEQPVSILPSVNPQGESYAQPPPLEDLPRSESWIQPPEEGDAPPSFTQVQKEDMMMREGRQDDSSGPVNGESSRS